MADKQAAIDYVLKNEDSRLSGKVTTDRGGRTRFGIAERFHPQLGDAFYLADHDSALAEARAIYDEEYCQPMRLGELESQRVANKLLDMAVNDGVNEATHLLQKALFHCGFNLESRTPGPQTVSAINASDENQLLKFLRLVSIDFYNHVAINVGCTPDEHLSWLRRANKLGA